MALAGPPTLGAQGPQGPLWESYSRAAEVLRQALDAHGGAAAIRGLGAASFRWEGEDYAPTQGRVPSAAWDTTGNARSTTQDVRADLARNRYVFDREFRFPGGYLNAFRVVGNGRELVSYNPFPARGMGGTTYQRDTTGVPARRNLASAGANMPVLLLRGALAGSATLRYLGETSDGGVREEAITYTTQDGDLATLYFDAATHRLAFRYAVGGAAISFGVGIVMSGLGCRARIRSACALAGGSDPMVSRERGPFRAPKARCSFAESVLQHG
jgi:hypothetical protein